MNNNISRPLGLSLIPLLLSACGSGGLLTTVGPDYQTEPLPAPASWQAPQADAAKRQQAHQGDPAELMRWWERFQDPALTRLLSAAEQVSASVADARARIEEARANLVGADAAILPKLDSEFGSKRSSSSFGGTPFIWNQFSAGLQSSWEIDLFGGLARQQEVAQSQLESRNASWHDARVAVAVEVADAYLAYRYCEAQVQLLRTDSDSRLESARVAAVAGQSGFRSPGDVALATASAAEGNRTLLQQQAQCERSIKSLVAMTGLAEADLRSLLNGSADQTAKLPTPPAFEIASLPAKVLLQRPDVAAAERDLAEASANIGVQRAKQFPKLSLSGNITPTLQNINGAALMLAQTWAIGPTLSLPLFDAGKRAADVEVAKVQYQAAESRFRAKVRTAVKEVEDALVRLDSSRQRLPQGREAVSGYRANFQALQTLYQSGLGNLLDVETARRNVLASELALEELEQEQVGAWIALYRAAGGGWMDAGESPNPEAAAADPSIPSDTGNTHLYPNQNDMLNGGNS
ncbi:efflux transporter outer membrane subunit [Methylomonas sp. ZR1]|uniref:efflux transporter outer membrane subunit n=1 Tax=Methylomonas sp. ZR1 TaxID=1797072 RepID=UPI001492569C|nr:efflux transporter outer membrane subunit [Methylomonas sp. ZR1]NOV28245.1 efflux transporter outer membrane subunit [Methylomonas sp. ZR1]